MVATGEKVLNGPCATRKKKSLLVKAMREPCATAPFSLMKKAMRDRSRLQQNKNARGARVRELFHCRAMRGASAGEVSPHGTFSSRLEAKRGASAAEVVRCRTTRGARGGAFSRLFMHNSKK